MGTQYFIGIHFRVEENMQNKFHKTMNTIKRILAIPILLALIFSLAAPPSLAADQPVRTEGISSLGVVQQWSLVSPDANVLDEFGYSVAIDGNTAVIGARNADPNLGDGPIEDAGAAYVYVYNGKTWLLDSMLTAKNPSEGDTFGVSVAISGNTILVGATGVNVEAKNKDDDVFKDVGAAYIFSRSSGSWVQQAKLTASDWAEEDSFGSNVAIYKNTAVVSAETKDLGPLVDAGAVYVFYGSGKNWKQQAKLLPESFTDIWLGDYFGTSISIYGDLIAVGATQFDLTGESGSGKAYIFKRTGKIWKQEARLEAEEGRRGDAFGNSISIYGRSVVIGAHHADPDLGAGRITSAGEAFVFTDDGNEWKETATISAYDGLPFDQFGQAVDMYGDTIVVGADGATQAGNSAAGAVYVFKKSNGDWNLQTRAVTDPTSEDDLFGKSVGVYGNWFVVGASGRDPNKRTRAGEAFLNLLGPVQLPATGFAPARISVVAAQPDNLAYHDLSQLVQGAGEMVLEIPAQNVKMPIVGVPKVGSGWDVRWLESEAGYLEGTAFPTWMGNTGLVGHAVLSNGEPGPFAGLSSLRFGDPVYIHAWGQRYTYEVRESSLAKPDQLEVLKHEDLGWLTLITCQGFDELSGKYRWRRVVRAVLLGVTKE